MDNAKIETIDQYIATCGPDVQKKLTQLRQAIQAAAPMATEKISWRMPTFYWHGNLIHFAAFKNHIGLYPGADAIEAFRAKFEQVHLKYSKGAVQFPKGQTIPLELVAEIVRFNLAENGRQP